MAVDKRLIMPKEDKDLLLKDLCARLPYGVKCNFKYGTAEDVIILKCIDGNIARFEYGWYGKFHVIIDPQYIKPYLRPMSSMTEEERKMVCTMNALSEAELDDRIKYRKMYVNSYTIETFDLFNSNHFDYRGLIPMGVAIKVTEENNPYKE